MSSTMVRREGVGPTHCQRSSLTLKRGIDLEQSPPNDLSHLRRSLRRSSSPRKGDELKFGEVQDLRAAESMDNGTISPPFLLKIPPAQLLRTVIRSAGCLL